MSEIEKSKGEQIKEITLEQIHYILSFQGKLDIKENGELGVNYKKQRHGKIDVEKIIRKKFN